ncbi:hypothetical protein FGG08_006700 [Glutinoglossum americanum]|uniref:Uncharacterized protein n=1 Tax=Glutinoglossum americanum TaxID=1670608 RepID=A0A9P8I0Z7_9PEZI|nr:hypothetical protein FGG08_006700 [Glutinoglossum americanum]
MATLPSPGFQPFPSPPISISKRSFFVAGIISSVYGIDELPKHISEVACLWLLHPRLKSRADMEFVADAVLRGWYRRLEDGSAGDSPKGLIAVSFDGRNHGSREFTPSANEAWRAGNETHAQDMLSTYHGTALDASILMLYLPSFIFPDSKKSITTNLVLGVSLGGHGAWLSLLHEPSVTAAIIVIGCPDYVRLMSHRAAKSKRPSWVDTSPQGASFIGSTDFPGSLLAAVKKYDPAGLLMGQLDSDDYSRKPSDKEIQRLRPLMHDHLANKKILNLAGGADKLVPYSCSEPFLAFLSRAVEKDTGWFADGGVGLTNKVFEGVGHEMTLEMLHEAVEFVADVLTAGPSDGSGVPAGERDYPKI